MNSVPGGPKVRLAFLFEAVVCQNQIQQTCARQLFKDLLWHRWRCQGCYPAERNHCELL